MKVGHSFGIFPKKKVQLGGLGSFFGKTDSRSLGKRQVAKMTQIDEIMDQGRNIACQTNGLWPKIGTHILHFSML